MLRQIILIKDGNILVNHHFARAYNSKNLNTVLEKIRDIEQLPPNQIFQKSILNFQVIYGNIKEILYIFVTDFVDRRSYVEEELKKLSDEISALGNDIYEILRKHETRLEGIFQDLHYNLHPKISFAGPSESGRTTLIDLLKIKDEDSKNIMSFAKISKMGIDDIVFDLWDFIELDDYSPLWGNFLRGSDLIILVFNAISIMNNKNKVPYFINLCKKEGKDSKIFLLLSHSGNSKAIKLEKFKEEFADQLNCKVYAYEIFNSEIENQIRMVIEDTLFLKKPLPENFRSILLDTNSAISNLNYPKAIQNLKFLITIADDYQKPNYIAVFKNKINELQKELNEQRRVQKLEESKITAPEKISFDQKITVKNLGSFNTKQNQVDLETPAIKPLQNIKIGVKSSPPVDFENNLKNEVPLKKGIKDNILTFERSPLVKDEIVRKTIIKEKKDIPNGFPKPPKILNTEEKIKIIEKEEKDERKEALHGIFSTDRTKQKPISLEKAKKSRDQENDDRLIYEQELLYSSIKKHGKTLRLDLCRTFILQIRTKLEKSHLDDDYIINAAKLYVQKLDEN